MEIVVNDTNIFIDLHSIGLLDKFFELPISVHTVDFVINEITEVEQLNAVTEFIENGRLKVVSFRAEELAEVVALHNSAGGNVSLIDCAVWHYAKINNYTLLTGDNQLRKKAIMSNVKVRGVIYIFDVLLDYKIISPKDAVIKIKDLRTYNPRLPQSIIEERIEKWSNL